MLARLRKSTDEKDQGFTLIELLVVMIIIGILAAIAIPVFLSQRSKAQDTATKADLATIGKEIATYYVDGTGTGSLALNGATAVAAGAATDAIAPNHWALTMNNFTRDVGKASANVVVDKAAAANIASDTAWCVSLTNPNGATKTYKYSLVNGLSAGSCNATTS